jgi:hypothetical protein
MQWGKVKSLYLRAVLVGSSIMSLLVAAGAGSAWD